MVYATRHVASRLPSFFSLRVHNTHANIVFDLLFKSYVFRMPLCVCHWPLGGKLFVCSWSSQTSSDRRIVSHQTNARFARSLLSFRFFYFALFSHRCIDTIRVQTREKRKFLVNEIVRPKYRRYIYLFHTNRLLIYGSCEINWKFVSRDCWIVGSIGTDRRLVSSSTCAYLRRATGTRATRPLLYATRYVAGNTQIS